MHQHSEILTVPQVLFVLLYQHTHRRLRSLSPLQTCNMPNVFLTWYCGGGISVSYFQHSLSFIATWIAHAILTLVFFGFGVKFFKHNNILAYSSSSSSTEKHPKTTALSSTLITYLATSRSSTSCQLPSRLPLASSISSSSTSAKNITRKMDFQISKPS